MAAVLIAASASTNILRSKLVAADDQGDQHIGLTGVDAFILLKHQRLSVADNGRDIDQCFSILPEDVRALYAAQNIQVSWFGVYVLAEATLCEEFKANVVPQ